MLLAREAVDLHRHHGAVASPEQVTAFRDFLDSEDFGALHHELTALREGSSERPKGRVRDLDALFDRLNVRFSRGGLPRPHLLWHAGVSMRRFGFYVASRDQVHIDVRLDDERVPEFLAEFVLYHELLHKVHGARMRGRRRHVHTPAFREDERRFPRWEEAEAWLTRLATEGAEGARGGEAEDPMRGTRCGSARGPMRSPEQPPRPAPDRLHTTKVPRNAPCPCGSGHKYKKCCLGSVPPVS